MVRAKFRVESKTETTSGICIDLSVVTGDSDENKKFFKWTPYGTLKMGTLNDEASAQFVVGKEYYIDFTQAN